MTAPSQPPCIAKMYPDHPFDVYVIPEGTLLYTGARDTYPISKANARLSNKAPDDTYYYKYFTTKPEVAKQFAKLNLKHPETHGYVATYRIKQPIPIFLNYLTRTRLNDTLYFNSLEAYASPEAQCLCSGGFHGYGTMTDDGLDDIGLCAGLKDYLELVEYTTVKSGFTSKTTFGGRKTKRLRRSRRTRRKYFIN